MIPATTDDVTTDLEAVLEASTYVSAATFTRTNNSVMSVQLDLQNLTGDANGDNLVVVYTATTEGLTLTCTGGDLEDKYRPTNCR